jgi:hypothetical protein
MIKLNFQNKSYNRDKGEQKFFLEQKLQEKQK